MGASRDLAATEVNLSFRLSGAVFAGVWLLLGVRSWQVGEVPWAVLLGVVAGLFAFVAGYAGLRALDFGSLNATWTMLRVSAVIPVLVSIVIWGELRGSGVSPREVALKVTGTLCMLGALLLLGRARRE